MKCDFCDNKAKYDVRIPLFATWAYVCELHFELFECSLGLGKGQRLKTEDSDLAKDKD